MNALASSFSYPDRFLGLDSLFDSIEQFPNNVGFPKYNIIKTDKDYTIEVALSGFTKDDIDVSLDKAKNTLTIKSDGVNREVEFVHKGISSKRFSTSFRVSGYLDLSEAKMSNGMLTINLTYEAPEENVQRVEIG